MTWCTKTRIIVYKKNHLKPVSKIVIFIPDSNSLCAEMLLITKGRKNAIITVAAACIPMVPLNKSMIIPNKKASINNNQPGVSNGKSKINNI